MIYQDALTLLEYGQYQAAQKRFEQIPHYKDSHALIQTCHQAYLQAQKEEAITFMQKGRYDKALPLLKSVEADGLDCSAEITACEQGYLELNKDPYVTGGNPVGKETTLYYSARGDVEVHSMTRVNLDNDCVRYTIDCTIPECEFVSFFDPPDGDIFMYTDWNRQEQGRHTYVFDALKKDVKAAKEMTVRFGHQENFVFTRNPY